MLSENPPPKGLAPPPESCDRSGDSGASGAGGDSEAAAKRTAGLPRAGPINIVPRRSDRSASVGSSALSAPTASKHASGPHAG